MSGFKNESNPVHQQFQNGQFLGILNLGEQSSLFNSFAQFSPSTYKPATLSQHQTTNPIDSTNFHAQFLNFQQFSNILPQFSQTTTQKRTAENDPINFLFNPELFKLPKHSKPQSLTSQSFSSNCDLEKSLIYEHRLFPLLKFLFEKCEHATANPDVLFTNKSDLLNHSSNEHQRSLSHQTNGFFHKQNFPAQNNRFDNFDQELECFLNENKEILTGQNNQNSQNEQFNFILDDLMLKSILVLRLHLFEIEKVNELCRDFSERYIETIKVKLNSDNVFKSEDELNESNEADGNESDASKNRKKTKQNLKQKMKKEEKLKSGCTSTPIKKHAPKFEITPDTSLSKISLNMLSLSTNDSCYQSVGSSNEDTNDESDSNDNQKRADSRELINEETNDDECNVDVDDVDEIEMDADVDEDDESVTSFISENASKSTSPGQSKKFTKSNSEDLSSKLNSKNKRGILPKNATNVMKKWLFQHIVHPYPTEEEKKQIASQTNLTLIQVNNWFINARRRILQPMLEASNPDLTKKKKSSQISQSRPYQNNRYWPKNLSNLAMTPKSEIIKSEDFQNSSSSSCSTPSIPSSGSAPIIQFSSQFLFPTLKNETKKLKFDEKKPTNQMRNSKSDSILHENKVEPQTEQNSTENLIKPENPSKQPSPILFNQTWQTHAKTKVTKNSDEQTNKDRKLCNALNIENLISSETPKLNTETTQALNFAAEIQQRFYQQLQSLQTNNFYAFNNLQKQPAQIFQHPSNFQHQFFP